jgi:hypothetical protein
LLKSRSGKVDTTRFFDICCHSLPPVTVTVPVTSFTHPYRKLTVQTLDPMNGNSKRSTRTTHQQQPVR